MNPFLLQRCTESDRILFCLPGFLPVCFQVCSGRYMFAISPGSAYQPELLATLDIEALLVVGRSDKFLALQRGDIVEMGLRDVSSEKPITPDSSRDGAPVSSRHIVSSLPAFVLVPSRSVPALIPSSTCCRLLQFSCVLDGS
jgi:hypothetical protein